VDGDGADEDLTVRNQHPAVKYESVHVSIRRMWEVATLVEGGKMTADFVDCVAKRF